ncbi:MAG: flagellin [Pirellulaceae bacterium]
MTRINTNVSSLVAQNRLNKNNSELNTSLTRLSTGLRINTGKDDPAGLIASEALRSDITSINKALSNTQRASQIIATADSALGQVSSLLNDVRGLVVEAANNGALSDDEIAANQLQIDSSLEAINRIAQTTTFQGRRLLDGSLDFITKAGSGFNTVSDLKIDQANLGTAGSIAVDVNITSAATKATVSSTGIPAATTAVNSTGTITFPSDVADAESSGTVSFADSYTIGTEANATVTFTNSYLPGAEASVNDFVIGNDGTNDITIDIDAVDGGLADGEIGNTTEIVINQVANGTASTAAYDDATNTLTLNVEQGQTIANIVSALDADLAGDFDIAAGTTNTGTSSATVASGNFTNQLSGGSNTLTPGTFNLAARDGGAADGAVGNDTVINVTSGTSTAATFDAETNILNITVADGATIADIAAAINDDVGDDFIASNVTNGTSIYDPTDNFTGGQLDTNAGAISGATAGTNPVLASSFVVEAANNGLADGTKGDSTKINIALGAATSASYDADNDEINVVVAEGATTQAIADAINGLSDFVVRNVQNGNALFNTAGANVGDDVGPTFSGGTDSTANDVITVTADEASADADGTTITLTADNSLAAGTASASLVNGNIVVNVSSLGAVSTGTIASAISELDGFTASVTESNGDGSYDIANIATTETPATTAALSGGQFGGGLNADLVVQLTGATGSEVFQFEKGASLASVIQSINLVSDATGIQAEDDGGSLKLSGTSYGSDSLVAVEVISEGEGGTFESGLTSSRANGTDVVATVNGTAATGKGNTLSINTSTLDLELTVSDGSSTSVGFTITGGGAQFQLGPEVVSNQQARLGIGSLNTAKLGSANGRLYELASGGDKALAADITGAARVINDVINKVTNLRGRLGAFQATTLESNLNSLNDTVANLTEAESSIRDADFAAESARLTRAQILVQSGTSVLGIANQNPQNVLSLLR